MDAGTAAARPAMRAVRPRITPNSDRHAQERHTREPRGAKAPPVTPSSNALAVRRQRAAGVAQSAFRAFRRKGVAAAPCRSDPLPAGACIERLVGLDLRRFARERFVLDRIAKPCGVVVRSPMMLPRLVVDAVRELHEEHEIVRAQIEPPVRAAEVEAAVLPETPFRVLERMTPMLLPRLGDLHDPRAAVTA